jgi:hypothetical protein
MIPYKPKAKHQTAVRKNISRFTAPSRPSVKGASIHRCLKLFTAILQIADWKMVYNVHSY